LDRSLKDWQFVNFDIYLDEPNRSTYRIIQPFEAALIGLNSRGSSKFSFAIVKVP
jgi:hypothetical protein